MRPLTAPRLRIAFINALRVTSVIPLVWRLQSFTRREYYGTRHLVSLTLVSARTKKNQPPLKCLVSQLLHFGKMAFIEKVIIKENRSPYSKETTKETSAALSQHETSRTSCRYSQNSSGGLKNHSCGTRRIKKDIARAKKTIQSVRTPDFSHFITPEPFPTRSCLYREFCTARHPST